MCHPTKKLDQLKEAVEDMAIDLDSSISDQSDRIDKVEERLQVIDMKLDRLLKLLAIGHHGEAGADQCADRLQGRPCNCQCHE